MSFLSIIDTYVKVHIIPGVVDNVFKHSPLFAYLKRNQLETFPGGSKIQENFRYAGLKGKFYSKGEQFDVTKKQTDTGMQFDPKFFEVGVTEYLEDINVFIKGPEAVFKLLDADMQNAADSMAAKLSIATYLNGQRAGYTKFMNGLAEIVSDASTAGFDGSGASYTTYGGITRGGTVGPALSAKVTNVNGRITYNALETAYNDVVIGTEYPNIAITTNKGMSYLRHRFQPQQKVETLDAVIGFTGLKFNSMVIMQDQYCPGSALSAATAATEPIVYELMNDMGLTYPTLTAETLWMLNTKWFKLYVTNDPLFSFGFTGFKRAQDNTTVVGQYLYSGNIVCVAPRYQHQLYGITG